MHGDPARGSPPAPIPFSLPGLDSQIFEVCSSTKSFSGDGLNCVLTQVPERIKPEGEKHWSEEISLECPDESGRPGWPDGAPASRRVLGTQRPARGASAE